MPPKCRPDRPQMTAKRPKIAPILPMKTEFLHSVLNGAPKMPNTGRFPSNPESVQ